MPHRVYRSFQAMIMLLLAMFLAGKFTSNRLSWFINPRFWPLTVLGILLLGIMAQTLYMELRRSRRQALGGEHERLVEHDHDAPNWGNLWIALIPLVIGILVPARPLDATAVATRGLSSSAPLVRSNSTAQLFETDSEQRDVLDWLRLFNMESNISSLLGESASVIGFVYHDPNLSASQFYLSRFIVTCCAADGFAVAMLVDWPEADSFENNAWLLVKGPVELAMVNGQRIPLIKAESVTTVPAPDQPYLYP